MLVVAEHAATTGDLDSADELLRRAARIQEAELGPVHPDLASTLNNLAIVAEKAGRPTDAEALYRRAAAVAAASLPADHPMVAESRQNFDDFCRARGLAIDEPVVIAAPVQQTELGSHAFARPDAAGHSKTPNDAPTPSQLLPPTFPRASGTLAKVAISVGVLVAAALLLRRPWSSTGSRTAEPAAAHAAEPAVSPPAMPAPIEQVQPPTVVPRNTDRNVVSDTPRNSKRSSNAVTLATVQLCHTLSTSSANWRCDPVGDSVAPGPIVLYTRVKSPRDAEVIHRWYRGETLRQSVELAIRANTTEGYRTYSRCTLVSGGDWRVEVRSLTGDLLHEHRFTVR